MIIQLFLERKNLRVHGTLVSIILVSCSKASRNRFANLIWTGFSLTNGRRSYLRLKDIAVTSL